MKYLKEILSDFSESVKYNNHHIFCHTLGRRVIMILIVLIGGFNLSLGLVPKYHEFVSVSGGKNIPMFGITSLTYDDIGFIWGASRLGILRATPSDVSIYNLPVSTSDVMQMKLAYNKGVLVAASQNGQIFRYDRIKDRFEQWFSLSDILSNKEWITNIIIDESGNPWISTSVGIFVFSDGELINHSKDNAGYSYILKCGGKDIFALSNDNIYRISSDKKESYKLSGKFSQFVSSAVYDSYRNRILIGTYQGELWEYRLKDQLLKRIDSKAIPELIIRSVLVPDADTFLLGMEGGGIIVFEAAGASVLEMIKEDIDNPASLKGNSVFAMTTDREGRLWVATTSAGLQYSDINGDDAERIQHRYNTASSLHNNEVNFLLKDKDGCLWVATNDGISVRDAKDGTWHQLYGKNQLSVLSLAQGKNGLIYASTYGNGVYVIDPKTYRQVNHFSDKNADIFGKGAYVFSSFTDFDGDIWFGGVKGDIVCYSPEKNQFKKYESHPVFCFAQQKQGEILTGGGDGLILIDKQSGKTQTLLADNVVQQILVDGTKLWICTSGNGLIQLDQDSGHNKSITVNDGLHSNFTRSIIKHGDKLWIGTALGMSCYDIEKGVMLQLPGRDLLTNDAFRENSSCVLPDGKFAFGTNNGIVTFSPEKILDLSRIGKIFFSDIKVSGRSIRKDIENELTVPIDSLQELVLNYPRNSFTLSMQALGNVGSNVMYSWKLEGVDKEWTELSSVSSINYVNLDNGSYSLKIRMYDGGFASERELKVIVKPPFWETVWFRIIILIVVVVLAALVARHYFFSMCRRHAFEKLLLSLQIAKNVNRHSLPYLSDDQSQKSVCDKSEEKHDPEFIDPNDSGDLEQDGNLSKSSENNIIENEFLSKAMECVRENISNESFGKGDFASAMMISQSLLYKKIKAITDMSVVEFIRSIRLNHAMTLLTSGKYNVTEVSEMCGFSSSAYFSRVFKDNFGISPSEIIPDKGF